MLKGFLVGGNEQIAIFLGYLSILGSGDEDIVGSGLGVASGANFAGEEFA